MQKTSQEMARALVELEAAYNQAPVGLCVIDTDLRFRRINPRLAEMNGMPVEAHIGRTVRELLPDVADAVEPRLRELFETGVPRTDVEISGMTPAQPGVLRHWRESWYPLRSPEGRIIGVNVAAIEITEQKRIEQALEKSRQMVRERVEELESVMGSAPAAIVIAHDRECTLISGNSEAHTLFGIEPGHNLSASAADGRDARRPFDEYLDGEPIEPQNLPLQRAARTARPVRDAQITLRFHDGRTKHIFGNALPLFDPVGSVRGAVGVFIDVTALKAAEEQLATEARNKDTFLFALSHELRNPLNAVSAGIAVLKQKNHEFPALAPVVDMLTRQIRQITRVLDDLSDIARISRGRIALKMAPCDLRDVVCDAVQANQVNVEQKKQDLHLRLPHEPVMATADSARMTQIVSNLVNNASKYSPPQSTIQVELTIADGEAAISVKDEGQGIPPDLLPRIFEKFYLEKSDDVGAHGLGMGLWLSRRLAEMQGGRITVASEGADKGADFTVRIPVR